ncbi:YfhO family protein, partial [Candidatus Sumerlaeota bacterium]|nr:YfhO family protein [Candidatus Sumerlaeota bacterium]
GWKARANGKPVSLYPANYLFQAIYVTEGDHDVLLYYSPSSFTIGACLSLFSLIGLILAGVIIEIRRGNLLQTPVKNT